MDASQKRTIRIGTRRGAAAVEFAICAVPMFLLLIGLWEVGRMVEVQQVVWTSAREAARDASLGQDNLFTVATNLASYLQNAEPNAFANGHATSLRAPSFTLPANTVGYTCWDTTASPNKELFTITFVDITNGSVSDPTGMAQLDRYEIGIQVPYASIGWSTIPQITGITRLQATVDWVCMVDSPFQITPTLPAQ
jgi:Flp pilus assembly protein TadG